MGEGEGRAVRERQPGLGEREGGGARARVGWVGERVGGLWRKGWRGKRTGDDALQCRLANHDSFSLMIQSRITSVHNG